MNARLALLAFVVAVCISTVATLASAVSELLAGAGA